MDFRKFIDIGLTAMLTLFVGVYFNLSGELKTLSSNNVEVRERIINLSKTVDRHELELEKIKVEMLTTERRLTQQIYELRLECLDWIKKANSRIDTIKK
jgi:hypothetical protein